ncbi:MAG: adenylosuccinate lyase [Bacteroidetes bacterium HGW-Bacteroidetes-11]|jgi:adenylosuccinate lyase|nr:MAG: adenylosuccinate lyase [Bacteroidetes bacterium HGW-Bacteroidetes-11]
MELTVLNAISPVDGRYRKQVEGLAYFFSEAALINYRVFVETEYFIALCQIPLPQLKNVTTADFENLRALCRDFTFNDAAEVKEIEATTNHDVKAVEYYLKKKFDKMGLGKYKEFLHFGLTSQDINNTSGPYALRLAMEEIVLPILEELVKKLTDKSKTWKNIPMLARTHGQPATPTTVGKELYVFVDRLKHQIKQLKSIPYTAKFGGATGNLNAHYAAYPEIDWIAFADKFTREHLNLERQKFTTQIEHYDNLAALFDALKRINNIMIDLSRDVWAYVSMDYFKQKIKSGEVGSSAMPHKVNPIDFENAEGNLGIANALFEHLSSKLPISRLQRDLTDSTVSRNIGIPAAHTVIAIKSITRGLSKLVLNEEKIALDLENNWAVVAEAIQTILRREGFPKPYEALKGLTRTNTRITSESIRTFIEKLNVSDKVKNELLALSPHNYTGHIGF